MEKAKVISAYRRGFLTLQECAQILGMDADHLRGLLEQSGHGLKRVKAARG